MNKFDKGYMMGLFVCFALVFFISMIISAEAKLEHFTTYINITTQNNTIKIIAGDLQTRTYSYSSRVNETITINLYRNTTCKEETLFNLFNQTNQIYPDLVACNNLKQNISLEYGLMKGVCYDEMNTSFKIRYDNCAIQSSNAQSNYNECNKDLDDCKKAKGNWWMYALGGAAIVFFLMNKKSYAKTPPDDIPLIR